VHIGYLFSRFAVEMLGVARGIGADLVDDAIPMVGWGIERIKLQRHGASVDDVVIDPGRDEYREAGLNRCPGGVCPEFCGFRE